jgi:hypothetical protein
MLTIESLNKRIIWKNIPYKIEEERVLREMRISKVNSLKEMPEQNIARYIKNAIEVGYSLIDAKAIYTTLKVVKKEGEFPGLESAPGFFFGKKIAELLNQCDYVTLMLTTIGPALPDKTDEMIKKEPTDSFYLEHVGGWMADYLADRVEEKIALEAAKNGYALTMRYSPGYGDWTLDAQPKLLALLESEKIGVRLTDSLIMIPRKSVSAALGWTPKK